jgi:hypothetical protein
VAPGARRWSLDTEPCGKIYTFLLFRKEQATVTNALA